MRPSTPTLPEGVARVREEPVPGRVPLYAAPGWREAYPWLVQGTTGAGEAGEWDFGLAGQTPVGEALERWRLLRESVGIPRANHALQVHGREVVEHDDPTAGLHVLEGVDGHLSDREGVLLTVSVADCVPIFLTDPERRIALLHGGWRGTAAGIVEEGLRRLDASPDRIRAHLGPAICGSCYEVGPEVHEALGLAVRDRATPVDIRAVQAHQLVGAGVRADRITVSEHCTRCGEGFFSHRGGSTGRQLGVLGIR